MQTAKASCPGIRQFLLWAATAFMLLARLAMANPSAPAQEISCANCHGDKVRLRSLSPQWRDVYVDLEQFAADKHGAVGCTACHQDDIYADFPHGSSQGHRQDPADPARVKSTCGSCHAEITARHLNSLHSTLEGHKRSLIDLMGQEKGMARFSACTSCHATCTDCHMKQPDRYNRLVPQTESHRFTRRPAAVVCKVCHGQTAETYLGARGNAAHGPSVMATAGLECLDCHSGKEIHGSGKRPGFIGETVKPNCETCHARPGLAVPTAKGPLAARQYDPQNSAHRIHKDRLACVSCHTQWYTNCWDCHKGRAREDGDKFFLAVNPETGKIHTAIHVPINTELGGVSPELGGWAVKTRHSWGKSQSCEKCHTDPAVYVNPELRRARFVSFWSSEHTNATFMDEKLVKQVTIDKESFSKSPHKDLSCQSCHNSSDSRVCADCHGAKRDRSRAVYRQSDELLQSIKQSLAKLRTPRPEQADWESRWTVLRDRYMHVANEFHGNPRAAQRHMRDVRQAAGELHKESTRAVRKAAH